MLLQRTLNNRTHGMPQLGLPVMPPANVNWTRGRTATASLAFEPRQAAALELWRRTGEHDCVREVCVRSRATTAVLSAPAGIPHLGAGECRQVLLHCRSVHVVRSLGQLQAGRAAAVLKVSACLHLQTSSPGCPRGPSPSLEPTSPHRQRRAARIHVSAAVGRSEGLCRVADGATF